MRSAGADRHPRNLCWWTCWVTRHKQGSTISASTLSRVDEQTNQKVYLPGSEDHSADALFADDFAARLLIRARYGFFDFAYDAHRCIADLFGNSGELAG